MSSTEESCRLSYMDWWLWDVDVLLIDCGARLALRWPRPAERKAPGADNGQVTYSVFFGIAVKKLTAGVVRNACDHRHFWGQCCL